MFDLVILSGATVLLQAGITDGLLIDYLIPLFEDMVVTSFTGLAIAAYFYNK